MTKYIGVFGSAFDPIHLGHIDCLRQIEKQYELIIVVPSFAHAFSKQMTSFDLRVNSVITAVKEECALFSNRILVSDIERDIAKTKNGEPVYTFDVLSSISTQFKTDDIEFVVGPDNADPDQWTKFYRSEDILNRWGINPVKERCNIRSSLIRKMISNKQPKHDISLLIPRNVLSDIEKHNLYGA
jgi:nicotinate-nucleotide adenylyltransferase